MLRKLFTLMLLVTGLAALGQPAQARTFEVESARAAADAGYASAAQPGLLAERRATPHESGEVRVDNARFARAPAPIVPTVRLKVDRARE